MHDTGRCVDTPGAEDRGPAKSWKITGLTGGSGARFGKRCRGTAANEKPPCGKTNAAKTELRQNSGLKSSAERDIPVNRAQMKRL